jgi:cyanophycinase
MQQTSSGKFSRAALCLKAPITGRKRHVMRERWSQFGVVLLLGFSGVQFASGAREAKGGHLVIIGGGHRPENVTHKFIELAGGTNAARIVVIGFASEDYAEAARSSAEDFRKDGAWKAEPIPGDREQAVEALRNATGVYFTGGDQQKLVDAVAGTPFLDEIKKVWRRGGVIGGTSAGAAVMSAKMITGEERGNPPEDQRFRSIQRDQITVTNGFGFVTNAIVDQHFITRRRLNRLFSVVLDNPKLLGVGIDESTAVVVGPDQIFEVIGDKQVMVIDARRAKDVRTGKERRIAAEGLRVHLLVEGDGFDLRRGRKVTNSR